ncbi:MAG: SPOR domain-containing protein [Candidatus Omnitrophica bacterium]|nr:SPOR domain-containing protein [Candidatus Omnitrophota bacterium]
MDERDRQLELFDVAVQPSRRRGAAPPFANFTLHADHLVLLVIVGLIGTSVVFALGVERGKHLALGDTSSSDFRTTAAGSPASRQPLEGKTKATLLSPPATTVPSRTAPSPTKTPAPKKTLKTPVRVASDPPASAFAIQVVSYRNPALAQQELQRLRRQGEQAFLVQKTGRLLLCVGPFPSKARASDKLTSLKPRYGDCFVRSL